MILLHILAPMVMLLASEACDDLQMTSKVISDPKFELTGLNDPSYYAFLASKCFLEIIKRRRRRPIIIHRLAWRYETCS